jgi:hypothetical protein
MGIQTNNPGIKSYIYGQLIFNSETRTDNEQSVVSSTNDAEKTG